MSTPVSSFPSPAYLGLPPIFGTWRPMQVEALIRLLESPHRFLPACMPTGFGKTLVNLAYALSTGARALYLTSTKGLEDQVLRDFAAAGVTDVRGMANYRCAAGAASCADGKCRDGVRCEFKDAGCDYFDTYRDALRSRLVVTNYSYWMAITKYGRGLGAFDVLIADEAHEAPEEVSSALRVEVATTTARTYLRGWPDWAAAAPSLSDWRIWAQEMTEHVRRTYMTSRGSEDGDGGDGNDEGGSVALRSLPPATARAIRGLAPKLKRLASLDTTWVAERTRDGWSWEPTWPGPYAEEMLWQGIPKIVLSSATLRPKTLELLGVKPGEYEFREYPSAFAVKRRPIIYMPANPTLRVDSRMTAADRERWVGRADQWLERRLAHKGILHPVSYERTRYIVQRSRWRQYFITHDSARDRDAAVKRFRAAKPPAILVSPSVGTGFDFPGDQCRHQLIMKIAFPDTRSAVMAARQKADPDYGMYSAVMDLVQTAGRGNRSIGDWCETGVMDDHFGWWWWRYGERAGFAPKWLCAAVRTSVGVPDAMAQEG